MPQGDLILVKTSGARPAVRRVWEAKPAELLIVHDEYYLRWQQHQHIIPQTYSVPRDRVFQHDATLAERLTETFQQIRRGDAGAGTTLDSLWAQAQPYTR